VNNLPKSKKLAIHVVDTEEATQALSMTESFIR